MSVIRDFVNIMDIRGLNQNDIADNTKVSNASICNIFSEDENKKEAKFLSILDIAIFLDPSRVDEFMTKYAYEVKKPENIKAALEYFAVRKLKEELRSLIVVCLNHKNKSVVEWGKCYEIHLNNIKKSQKESKEFLHLISVHNSKDNGAVVFIELMKCYHYLYNHQYKMVDDLLESVKIKIDKLSDSFVKKSFQIRISQFEGQLTLKLKKDTKTSKDLSNFLINNSFAENYKSYGYFLKGMSYFYEDYDNAIVNLTESKKGYLSLGMTNSVKDVDEKMNLLKYYWGKAELKSVESLRDTENTPLKLYMEGMEEQDTKKMYISMTEFVKYGDVFFSELPKKYLMEIGQDEDILNSIQNMNVA